MRQLWVGGSCGVVIEGGEMASSCSRLIEAGFPKEYFPAG